jgi:hypothetical protein
VDLKDFGLGEEKKEEKKPVEEEPATPGSTPDPEI